LKKLNRREFAQQIALAAGAALIPSFSLLAKQAISVSSVNQLAYAVNDYRACRDFYVQVLGMRAAWDNGAGCFLSFGSAHAPNGLYIRNVVGREKPNFSHLAFGMPNFSRRRTTLHKDLAELNLLETSVAGGQLLMFKDPGGFSLSFTPLNSTAGVNKICEADSDGSCRMSVVSGSSQAIATTPNGAASLEALAYSHIVLTTHDFLKDLAFYRDVLGMQVLYYKPEENHQCMLRFGENTLYLRPVETAASNAALSGTTSYLKPREVAAVGTTGDHFSFVAKEFNSQRVKEILEKRGFSPKPDSNLAWSITDPGGFRVEVADWGVPEHVSRDCHGSIIYNPITKTGGCPTGSSS
jgi:catechol 2,3-dioxygenase-like lactoylglutathione lyase family enzyme